MERLETTTPAQLEEIFNSLESHVTLSQLIATCTIQGRGNTLKVNRPADGIYAYVWHMARFNSGLDTFVPTTAFFNLETGIREVTGYPVNFSVIRKSQEAICDWLNKWSHELVKQVGGDPLTATLRWGRALGLVR